jgi:putative N6-adenine-specific DNA methylase
VLTFERADVAALTARGPAGTVVTNPPYGERLKPESLGMLYRSMGRAFERLVGWRVVVLSGSPVWTREVRRKPVVTHKLWNGALEVRLLAYDMR